MTDSAFEFAARLLKDRAAIVLESEKLYLLDARVTPLAQKLGLKTAEEYILRIQQSRDENLIQNLIEAMVTTETMFFRDTIPFTTLHNQVLPNLIRVRSAVRKLNIWCAACSSGQEPYTIAIIIKEYFPELATWSINLTATDISREMLKRSVDGLYTQFELNRGMPPSLIPKYFQQEGNAWRVVEPIRRMIRFEPLNLAMPWPPQPIWDLIFMRNVMIYFDTETKRMILGRIPSVLAQDGFLILGGAETTFHLVDNFMRAEQYSSGYYQVVR
ncbi:protein-glutamate O-methyltransferase CheR [Telmatocola sphagniphila]|uniref:protein-glutamate O-methyltransferase n=1 Tax=Telmatocola sphagniphila TaxID=1123043 RepID=A0A8E6B9D8_9BACT|nr:protein-glutamate O-methyltransferase CheR [Telmatocola sphagniphila]QVL33561.1 protein-glutamate O-methyltransferase CheR [Telmatocola sphagniphila]